MPTLQLFDTNPSMADGSHRVRSPGGYESWRFDAIDPSQDVRISVAFHDGYVLHPDYVRRFNAYRRRPRSHAPPVPSEYPCLVVSAYLGQKELINSTISYPPRSLQLAGNRLGLGDNSTDFRGNKRTIHLAGSEISAELAIEPLFPINFDKQIGDGVEHHWRCVPVCRVWGKIQNRSEGINFDGYGQENHLYGSGPPTGTAGRWIRGQVLFPRAAVNFLAADEKAIAVVSDESGVRQMDESRIIANWDRGSIWSLAYPSSIDFGSWLTLRNPRTALGTPANLELRYDAYVDGQQTTAWVEIEYPDRLRGLVQSCVMKRNFVSEK
jgi:hypothetical protein